MILRIISFILFLFIIQAGNSQNINQNDSLITKSYKDLYEKIKINYDNVEKGNIYANAYLKKAKKRNDNLRAVEGYFYLSEINTKDFNNSLKYLDSALLYNRNNKSVFTPNIYNRKGALLHIKGDYKLALEYYLKAKKNINSYNNQNFINSVEHNIGLERLRIKDFKNASIVFKNGYQYLVKNNLKTKHINDYLNFLHSLSISYFHDKKLDSAFYYNQLHIKEAKTYNKLSQYHTSRIIEAYINYEKENYQQTIDSISKYLPQVKGTVDSINLAISNLYLGKSLKEVNNWKAALKQFKKIDTIIQNTQKYAWELKENYELLYNYYKNKNDLKNQLLYIEKQLHFDSILDSNGDILKNSISNQYDIPKLVSKKEILITKLKEKDRKKSQAIYLTIICTVLLVLITFFFFKRREANYKKRFEILLQEKKIPHKPLRALKKELKIPKDIVSDILNKITVFEEQKGFLDGSITLDSLAKKIETNSNYLSKVINFHMNKNFSAYLSNLRINYIVEALKEQPKLRKYTIKAIAFEVGFNNVKSFTDAFYKQTKIHPSYYIRELKKKVK
ncbi:helix-turn-helix domain-containing protein [Flavobacteriaceae bacterium R38]|nr:helix-turn-helix domain-containing protein [Flavobacteriaceae bacterium R38]